MLSNFLKKIASHALLFGLSFVPLSDALASHTCDTPDPKICGEKSGLVPFHKDAIHASLYWKKNSECPKMIILMRPSEYKPKDYLNPTVGGVFSGFNQMYLELVQAGVNLTQLDESGWSPYAPDLDRENTQIIDVCGLQSRIDTGVFTKENIADLTNADMALTDPYFENAGFSKGLSYNLFCSGVTAGADGRLYDFSFHDKRGNNGGRKINIFDTDKEKWIKRGTTCVRSQWATDPNGTFPHCSAANENNTDPLLTSDLKYKRWYPTALTLPDGKIIILSGSNIENDGPDESLIRQPVPEVYDPKTDKTIALENAQKFLPMYPRSFVIQTGKGKKDWKVCVVGEIQSRIGGGYDPFLYNGKTSCLDVQAALTDPNRNTTSSNHWTLVDTALNPHDSGAGVMMVTINPNKTWSQEIWMFGGSDNDNPAVATVEKIDFASATPKWMKQDDLIQPATQNNAVALPDGKILIVGGAINRGREATLQYQLFDKAGKRTDLVRSNVPRHDHSTALLMKNAGVWVMGGNRVDLIPGGDRNKSVPVLEHYKPPYFFQGKQLEIKNAPHKIKYKESFTVKVSSKEDRDVEVASAKVDSVVIIRTGPITHNWAWGNQYVKLPFRKAKDGKLKVEAPHLPGLAVPGDYLLFVVSKNGVPSEATHVQLKLH